MRVLSLSLPARLRARRRADHPSRLAHVDGARAVAALYVVLHHCWQFVWGGPGHIAISAANWRVIGWMSYGHYAVSAFIAISGFSLTLPVVRAGGQLIGGAWTFFRRRARRIVPTYYAAIAFTLLLDWLFIGNATTTAWAYTLPVTPWTVVTHLLLIQNLDPTGYFSLNGVFWSIAIEWQIYFFFPLLVLLARRLGMLSTTVGTAALSFLVFYVLVTKGAHLLQRLPPYWANNLAYLQGPLWQIADYLGLFALGMLAATVAYSQSNKWVVVRNRVPWGVVILSLAGAITVLLWFNISQPGNVEGGVLDVLVTLFTLSLFITAARRPTQAVAAKLLGARPLAFVGRYSYSIYLIHAPIIAVLYSYLLYPNFVTVLHFSHLAQDAVLVAVVYPTVLVVAYGFFWLFERPFLSKKPAAKLAPAALPV